MPAFKCVFCQIVEGKLPCYKLYEDSEFLAFLDIRPLNPGHSLVIPKHHYRWVWDVPNVGSYFSIAQRLAKALRAALRTELVIGLIVGEEVEHAHISLIPRFRNDGHGAVLNFSNTKQLSSLEMQKLAEKIRNFL